MFYKVIDKIKSLPRNFHDYGYETEDQLHTAICRLQEKWKGCSGECVGRKHGFLRLRIRNIYHGHDDVWFPSILVLATPPPSAKVRRETNIEEELDQAFGFD